MLFSAGFNVLLTCLSILAVDFPVFPRRFAKTETYGISLMDVGVGIFIVSSALTSKYARGVVATGNTSTASRLCRVLSLQHSAVLLLGVGRFVALKALNYQEHVSEYGVHWNFFVTLFCVWTIADILHLCVPRWGQLGTAVCVLCLYQTLLIGTELTAYIFSPVREGLLAANKEGIVSLFGYVPLYLLTECLAHTLFHKSGGTHDASTDPAVAESNLGSPDEVATQGIVSPSGKGERECGRVRWDFWLMRNLALVCMLLWLGWWSCTMFVQPTSRRLLNAAYVFLLLALCFTMLLVVYVADTSTQGATIPVLTLQYLSKHSLVVFLVANLLTGLVNLSMQTIYASDAVALCVLALYALAVVGVAWLAEYFTASGLKARPER
jgi:phosphatidylinositol glycan class W